LSTSNARRIRFSCRSRPPIIRNQKSAPSYPLEAKVPALKAAIEDLKADRHGARIDQGVCITSYASQCRTVDQAVVLADDVDAKGWYVSLSRAREAMHVYTRDKATSRQSVKCPGERTSVWELVQASRKGKLPPLDQVMRGLFSARQVEIDCEVGMQR